MAKVREQGMSFDYPVSAIGNKFLFCQDACQCLMLHSYITASITSSYNYMLSAVRVQQNDYAH